MTKEKKNQKEKPIKKNTKQVSKKKNDLKAIESEPNMLKEKHIRLKAEFENFRRRKSEEISKLLQYSLCGNRQSYTIVSFNSLDLLWLAYYDGSEFLTIRIRYNCFDYK